MWRPDLPQAAVEQLDRVDWARSALPHEVQRSVNHRASVRTCRVRRTSRRDTHRELRRISPRG